LIIQPKPDASARTVGITDNTAMPPLWTALQVTARPAAATRTAFTVTATVSLAVPQLGLLWLVTVIFKVAVPTLDKVTVGSSAVASEKVTPRSDGLLDATVQRILPFEAVAAITKALASASQLLWSGDAAE